MYTNKWRAVKVSNQYLKRTAFLNVTPCGSTGKGGRPPLVSYYCASVPLFIFFFLQSIPKLHNRRYFDPHYTFSFIHDLACSYRKVYATMHRRYRRIVCRTSAIWLTIPSAQSFPVSIPWRIYDISQSYTGMFCLQSLQRQIHNSAVRSIQTVT